MIPHTCPKCGGQGTVQKPPWVAGDQGTWSSTTTQLYSCPVCGGSGLIARPKEISVTTDRDIEISLTRSEADAVWEAILNFKDDADPRTFASLEAVMKKLRVGSWT